MRTTYSPELLQFESGVAFEAEFLKGALDDMETALFFGKLYKLLPQEMSELLEYLFPHLDVVRALTEGTHSTELQGYVDWLVPEPVNLVFTDNPTKQLDAELLPKLWEAAEIMIATSIQEVADKVGQVMHSLPTHEGRMTFQTLATHNRQRNTIGDYRAVISRRNEERQRKTLVILDDSGSMTASTIRAIVQDVVALAYKADATLALVSTTARVFAAGTFSVQDVLDNAEYGGTHYRTLIPLFDEDWDEVITIADYDSFWDAKDNIAKCPGRIGTVTDISLVARPTYLSECVGTLASEVRHVLISHNVI